MKRGGGVLSLRRGRRSSLVPHPSSLHLTIPPWTLAGSALLFLHSWRSTLALVHYDRSPVGAYNELAVVCWTRRGLAVTTMLVDSSASMHGGRANWGFPKRLAPLHWEREGRRARFEYSPRIWRARCWGPALPLRVTARVTQVLHGRAVRVPVRLQGRARLAWRGRQIGVFVDEFAMTVLPPSPVTET